ncbi:MAG: beta-galactosidase [Acidobacteriota bacterium]|nr:beta-galactosidase [Acidobacteriota bacterium]
MTFRRQILGVLAAVLLAGSVQARAAEPHTFGVANGQFVLDGKPFRILSGEMHYPRIPREYWRARLRMARAMGLNTITTYVFWNEHETSPGVYDFSGNNDVAEFIREAQQEGLYVILRPGPYVCAEWEWGGYPAWLLKTPGITVRSSDPKFMEPARRWLLRVGQELAPLQIGNGGPILLTQVENEYGSFGADHAYMESIKQALVAAGFTRSQLYTADGPEQVPHGSLPELPVGINFGGEREGDAERAFATLKQFRPQGPFINSEYWAGWFDHWGSGHAHTNAEAQAANLQWELAQGYSVSLYMFHGGTSFGWMNGANSDGKGSYEPDVTSYDYDSVLDESGRTTPKYFAFRDIITRATGVQPPAVPQVPAPVSVPAASLTQSASLWSNLPQPIRSEQVQSMEEVGQAYGYILYRTTLPESASAALVPQTVHSYAVVYVDGKQVGTIDRRLGQRQVQLPAVHAGARLDILVENTGRVNFGKAIEGERAGLTGRVLLGEAELRGWQIYPLPMTNVAQLPYSNEPCTGACFYRGALQVSQPGDTFLDTSAWTKGELWLNGRALGRIWDAGPQRALYAPGPWLRRGANDVIVFDLQAAPGREVRGLDHSVLDGR